MTGFRSVWVIGTGAVGSSVAAALLRSNRAAVTLVGSSMHWRTIREHGLTFEAEQSAPESLALQTAAPDCLPQLGAEDLVLFAGKLTQLEDQAAMLRERIGARAGVIALQNGLGVAELIGRHLERPVDRGLIYFGAHTPAPGRVRYYSGRIQLLRSPATERFSDLLAGSGMGSEFVHDLAAAEWSKLAINCLANPLAGLFALDNAGVGHPLLDPAKEVILAEVRAVARAAGVTLTLTVDEYNVYCQGPTGGNVPSLCSDLQRGEPTEIDFLNGTVIELGRRYGVVTPANELLVSLVKFLGREMS